MECGARQRECHSPGLWWCCTAFQKDTHTHPACHLNTASGRHALCVSFLKLDWAASRSYEVCRRSCVRERSERVCERLGCTHATSSLSVNLKPLCVWAGGGRDHWTFTARLSLARGTVLWCGGPRWGRLRESCVASQTLWSGKGSVLETSGLFRSLCEVIGHRAAYMSTSSTSSQPFVVALPERPTSLPVFPGDGNDQPHVNVLSNLSLFST